VLTDSLANLNVEGSHAEELLQVSLYAT